MGLIIITTYPPEDVDFFVEIALGAQFGDKTPVIRKWYKDLRIQVLGQATPDDMKTLRKTIEELNELMGGINIFLSYYEPNVSMYFAPESDFKKILLEYVPKYDGFFWTWWNENTITEARILIADRDITQERRSHNIRQLLTRSIGFLNNSKLYPESIFYSEHSETTEFADIDRTVIKMLYSTNIKHGQTAEELRRWLSG